MVTVYFLETDDVLEADDLVRSPIPASWRSQGADEANDETDWRLVGKTLPFWVGKRVGDYCAILTQSVHDHGAFEFLRLPSGITLGALRFSDHRFRAENLRKDT